MCDDSRHRESILEAQSSSRSSISSTSRNEDSLAESLAGERQPRQVGREVRTFDEDSDDSGSCSDGDARDGQRADLLRMMTRRNFALADVVPLAQRAHQMRAACATTTSPGAGAGAGAARAVATPAHGFNDTENKLVRRRSSVSNFDPTAEANEVPAEDEGHSNQVVDFFRTVNKDAHLLTRMGSNRFHGCGGYVVRMFASCLRRVGIGNPGVSVEAMAFGSQDPLDLPTPGGVQATTTSIGNTSGRGITRRASGRDTGEMDDIDEEPEEDDEEDEEELSAQKKKVYELGELPALNWSNTSSKLLVTVAVVGILLFTLYSGLLDECVELGQFCLRQWLNGLCICVGAYFVIELLAKSVAGFFKWTRLLHTNNMVWIFIKIHKNISLLIWITLIFFLWTWFASTSYAPNERGVIAKILGIFLAATATNVVSEMCKVEMAHRYMWRPYLERARASIWSQYVIFMMTDYAMGLKTKDAEGQALALGFTKTKKGGEHLSLYTVGKAIGFVHANALRHPLGPGRPGTDRDGMIDSKRGARLFGELLFDALMLNFNEHAQKLFASSGTFTVVSLDKDRDTKAVSAGFNVGLPRPFGAKSSSFKISPEPEGRLSSVSESPEEEEAHDNDREERKESEEDKGLGGGGGGGGGDADNGGGGQSTSTTGRGPSDRWSAIAKAVVSAPVSTSPATGDKEKEGAKGHRRGGVENGPAPRGAAGDALKGGQGQGKGKGGHTGIKLVHLRKMTSKPIARKMMELFEVAPDGVVTRKEFVERVVDIFVQRRSLQLTLADYEAILTKVGYVISLVSGIIVVFIALRIVGYDIGSLVLTWLSLAVAFSFLFGSSASAFFESIVFVFVTKAYDVGDPVFFVDDTGSEDWYIVTRINMLTTVFRRWDGQSTLIANNLMAKKAIRNQWRSSAYLHHTMIAVSADTSMEKLDQMKAGITAGMRRGKRHKQQGLGGMMPDTVDYAVKGLTDGNRLSLFVSCRQRENSANMGRRFSNSSFFHKLLVRECNRQGISYTLPTQPVALKGAEEALAVRKAFLGGSDGKP